MNLIRYQLPQFSPWSSLDRFASFRKALGTSFDAEDSGWTPALDLYDEPNRFLVTVEVPGVTKEGISISLQEGVLTVSGERKPERESQPGATFGSERVFGKFQRSVSLPAAVDGANVSATYQDGVLLVTLPKAEEAKPKKIQINVS